MKAFYVVLSRTGTILSRMISKLTGDWYTHASISLKDDLSTMYSFGRLWAYNPWIGGFVKESVEYGTMRRFRNADTVVIRVVVSNDKYLALENYLTTMYRERKKYKYNYWGLLMSKWRVRVRAVKGNRFYCSEFVNDCLERFGVVRQGEFGKVVRPMELLQLRQGGKGQIIYRGALCRFIAVQM
ncbi:MAG: hypothetical protein J5598_02880 [Clostridia bacterium]|nr:hypothetical protein [Clostridia bacterium]